MIINELYKTSISCVSEVDIDSTGVEVTVRLRDFNNQPVTGKKVKLTVDKGRLNTVKVGSNPSVSSNGKEANANTNSNGEITVTYNASEWGLVSFNANDDARTQLLVKGLRHITGVNNGMNYKIATDGYWCYTYISKSSVELTSSSARVTIGAIPSEYVPENLVTTFATHVRVDVNMHLSSSGDVQYHLSNATGHVASQSLYCSFTYSLKTPLRS